MVVNVKRETPITAPPIVSVVLTSDEFPGLAIEFGKKVEFCASSGQCVAIHWIATADGPKANSQYLRVEWADVKAFGESLVELATQEGA
jgi:hypothetical protein